MLPGASTGGLESAGVNDCSGAASVKSGRKGTMACAGLPLQTSVHSSEKAEAAVQAFHAQ